MSNDPVITFLGGAIAVGTLVALPLIFADNALNKDEWEAEMTELASRSVEVCAPYDEKRARAVYNAVSRDLTKSYTVPQYTFFSKGRSAEDFAVLNDLNVTPYSMWFDDDPIAEEGLNTKTFLVRALHNNAFGPVASVIDNRSPQEHPPLLLYRDLKYAHLKELVDYASEKYPDGLPQGMIAAVIDPQAKSFGIVESGPGEDFITAPGGIKVKIESQCLPGVVDKLKQRLKDKVLDFRS